MAKVRGLGHFGIYVQDMEMMTAFYTDALGMTVTDHDETSPRPAEVPTAPPKRRRTPRRARRAPAGPAARFDPGRVADARHRNPTWIIAGVLLVLLSALGGVLLFTSSDDRTGVLVAASDLEPGAVLTETDKAAATSSIVIPSM